MIYEELYGLQSAETLFRGTYRNPGWCETLTNIVALGFLDDSEKPDLKGKTLAQVTAFLASVPADNRLKSNVAAHLGLPPIRKSFPGSNGSDCSAMNQPIPIRQHCSISSLLEC
jgi:hypothetical protein